MRGWKERIKMRQRKELNEKLVKKDNQIAQNTEDLSSIKQNLTQT